MPESLLRAVADVPDFPKKGIVFKDITPILADASLFRRAVELMTAPWRDKNIRYVAGIEARGFIFAAAVARELSAGFIPVRKPGKLPRQVYKETYELEYGTDCLEIHCDAVEPGSRVLLVDDLLATGGTAAACLRLFQQCEADIAGVGFLIELAFLGGRKKLGDVDAKAIISYAGE